MARRLFEGSKTPSEKQPEILDWDCRKCCRRESRGCGHFPRADPGELQQTEERRTGLDLEADCGTWRQRMKVAQRRAGNKRRKLIGRRRAIACRLKQIDAALRNQDTSENGNGAA